MKNWKIGTRITAGFGAVIAIAMILGIFAYSKVGIINLRALEITTNSIPSVSVMSQVDSNAQETLGEVLQHVVATDKEETARVDAAIRDTRSRNNQLMARYASSYVRSMRRGPRFGL